MAFVHGTFCGPGKGERHSQICTRKSRKVVVFQGFIDGDKDKLEDRKAEIAAKIRMLKKKKSPKEKTESEELEEETLEIEEKGEADVSSNAENQLEGLDPPVPDGALSEEAMLMQEMEDAEKFMSEGAQIYKPKVSTWGVFERPDDISKAYGGGKRIPVGGVNLESEESQEKLEKTRELLQSYKLSSGLENKDEEKHREEILEAIELSNDLLVRARPAEAAKLLKPFTEVVGHRSELGGSLYLQLAVVFESMGMRDSAQDIYIQLKKSPVESISTRAKRLSFGFYAMGELNVENTSEQKLLYELPEFDVKKRYDASYIGEEKQKSLGLLKEEADPEAHKGTAIVVLTVASLAIAGAISLLH
ncbi:hypothetical protein NDN08_006170 [Rhodosorus marinus]|uniref:Uncharacterized protein n=1 Tax=Rhodosorus marinus TaxID=101924 RepID=A0AAV8UJX6_9RHOD|nr:hypothetical protein NDN08_006170 [Rhodosorus marinus]